MSDNKPWSELGSLRDLVVPRSEMNLPGFDGHPDGPPSDRRLRNAVRPPDGKFCQKLLGVFRSFLFVFYFFYSIFWMNVL